MLLQEGIGDTIRASLTPLPNGDRTDEVIVCQQILQALELRSFTPQVTACPGCGRTTSTFFQDMADQIQTYLREQMPVWKGRYTGVEEMKVAVMGCVVNGPGESKHSNIGISLPGTFEEPVAPVYVDGKLSTHVARRSYCRGVHRDPEQLRGSPVRRTRGRNHRGVSADRSIYSIRAVNTDPDSENKIHDDRVAAQYGFRGGFVPGVTVYGYMLRPLLDLATNWLEQGSMQVRLLQPVYDGDMLIARAEANPDGSVRVTAEREDGTVCASGTALARRTAATPEFFSVQPLPQRRPIPSAENLIPGTLLGTYVETLDTTEPSRLLQFSNRILMRNFELGPWIHAGSEIDNWSAVSIGDEISARGRIHQQFERKGNEFVVVDVMLVANGSRLVQTVRHTAIYRPRFTSAAPSDTIKT